MGFCVRMLFLCVMSFLMSCGSSLCLLCVLPLGIFLLSAFSIALVSVLFAMWMFGGVSVL